MPSFTSDVTFSLIGSKSIWSIKTTLFTWLLHQPRAAEQTSIYLSETRNFMQIIRQKNTHYLLFILKNVRYVLHSGGVGAVLPGSASQSWGTSVRFPDWSRVEYLADLLSRYSSLSFPSSAGSVNWVPAYMDRFEAAARGAYICFRPAGGKLIMEKALYKCTTLLYFTYQFTQLHVHPRRILEVWRAYSM